MYATESKAEKKKFFLQESRTKASPRNKLRAVCLKGKGAHRAPSMLSRAYQNKRKKHGKQKKKKRKQKNENPPTQMLRVKEQGNEK